MVPRLQCLQLSSIGTTMLPGSKPNRWDYELEMSYQFSTAWPEKVGRVGIEPTTPGLKVRCSAELS